MNIEKIIKNNNIEKEYGIVKEMEDLIQNIYKTNDNTDILDDEKLLIYRIDLNNKFNIKLHKTPDELLNGILLPVFLQEIYSDLIFYGSYVRTTLINEGINGGVNGVTNGGVNGETNGGLELFISTYISIENLDEKFLSNGFEKSETGYYKKSDIGIIHFISTKFKSIGEVLLYNPYLTRFGIHKNEFIVSSMFIIEYNLNIKHINTKKLDPKFSTEIDLFHLKKKLEKKSDTIFDLIARKDSDVIENLMKYNLDSTLDGLTPIEFALKLYREEECDIISHQLKLIIYELLNKIKFLRLPGFYANIIRLDETDSKMYQILTTNEFQTIMDKINANNSRVVNGGVNGVTNIKDIKDLNYKLLEYYISIDDSENFYSYLKLYVKKIDSSIIKLLCNYNPKKIITDGIKRKCFNQNNIYKLILFTQDLEYCKLIEFDVNIALNYIEDVVNRSLLRTFFYLFKQDKTIIQFKDSDGNTLLHRITQSGSYFDMIKLIITLDPVILSMVNDDGDTPLIFHIKQKNYSIVEFLLKNYNDLRLFEQLDNKSNTVLHLLSSSNDNIKLIKMFIYDNLHLINKVNMSNETPILISTKSGAEDIYFLLKSLGADLLILDDYGNSVYHYICLNSIVIGSVIENKPNIFGYTPEDYCEISTKYYAFV